MRTRMWMVVLVALLIIPGLMLTVACGPKAVAPEKTGMTDEEKAKMAAEEEARKQAMEEQRVREEQERARAEAEENARLQARQMFENEDVYFEFDRSSLTPAAQENLKSKAAYLEEHPDAKVVIEGHADERGTNEYNLALGDRRAESAKRFLASMGIDAGRMATISYGEERPVDPEHNEEAWAKNRRVHFVLQ